MLSGLALACAINSRSVVAGCLNEPHTIVWVAITIVTGAKSLSGSNGNDL